VFVKLITDGHVEGVGEAYCVPFDPHLVARMTSRTCGGGCIRQVSPSIRI
jgi:hypothetical protein